MSKYNSHKEWLREFRLTEEDIDEMWEGLAIMGHPTIKQLASNKEFNWRGLNPRVASDIPGIYDKYIKKFLNGEGTV